MKEDFPKIKFYTLIGLVILIILFSLIMHAKGYHFLFYKNINEISSSPFFPFIFILLYLVSSFFPLPFLTFLGAAVFPFYEAFLLSMAGNILFFIIMFYLTRWLGRDYVENYEKSHQKLKKLDLKINEKAFQLIFLLRLFFIIPPEGINIFAGLSKVKFKTYLLASIFGTIPVVIISILLIKSYELKQFHLFAISLIVFALLIIIPFWLIKKFRKSH